MEGEQLDFIILFLCTHKAVSPLSLHVRKAMKYKCTFQLHTMEQKYAFCLLDGNMLLLRQGNTFLKILFVSKRNHSTGLK